MHTNLEKTIDALVFCSINHDYDSAARVIRHIVNECCEGITCNIRDRSCHICMKEWLCRRERGGIGIDEEV
jgi:hypothetical protein